MNTIDLSQPSLGARASLHVVLERARCTSCGHEVEGVARKSVAGYKRFTCMGCRKEFDAGLHRRYRIGWWLLLAIFAGVSASRGWKPNLVLIVAGTAVLLDLWRVVRQRAR